MKKDWSKPTSSHFFWQPSASAWLTQISSRVSTQLGHIAGDVQIQPHKLSMTCYRMLNCQALWPFPGELTVDVSIDLWSMFDCLAFKLAIWVHYKYNKNVFLAFLHGQSTNCMLVVYDSWEWSNSNHIALLKLPSAYFGKNRH